MQFLWRPYDIPHIRALINHVEVSMIALSKVSADMFCICWMESSWQSHETVWNETTYSTGSPKPWWITRHGSERANIYLLALPASSLDKQMESLESFHCVRWNDQCYFAWEFGLRAMVCTSNYMIFIAWGDSSYTGYKLVSVVLILFSLYIVKRDLKKKYFCSLLSLIYYIC